MLVLHLDTYHLDGGSNQVIWENIPEEKERSLVNSNIHCIIVVGMLMETYICVYLTIINSNIFPQNFTRYS